MQASAKHAIMATENMMSRVRCKAIIIIRYVLRISVFCPPLLTPFQGTTNVYGQHKDSPIVVGNLKSGYRYTVMVCRVNGDAQGPDWSVKDVCAFQFCHIGSGATMVIMTPLNIVAWVICMDA